MSASSLPPLPPLPGFAIGGPRLAQASRYVPFSDIELPSGDHRWIRGAAGDRPWIALGLAQPDGETFGAILVYRGPDLALVEAAIGRARGPVGGRKLGVMRGREVHIVVSAAVYGGSERQSGVVRFARKRLNGEPIGKRVTVGGPELDALERACWWLRTEASP